MCFRLKMLLDHTCSNKNYNVLPEAPTLPCFARTFKGLDQEVCDVHHVCTCHVQQCIGGVLDPLLKQTKRYIC